MFVAGTEPDGKEWHALACLASAGTTDRFISELRNVAKMHPSGPSKFSFYLILERALSFAHKSTFPCNVN